MSSGISDFKSCVGTDGFTSAHTATALDGYSTPLAVQCQDGNTYTDYGFTEAVITPVDSADDVSEDGSDTAGDVSEDGSEDRTTAAPGSSSSSGGSGGADMGPIIGGGVAGAVLLLAVGALWFYRRSKGSETEPGAGVVSPPPLVPLKARPEGETTVVSVAPEAEETLPAQPAEGWFAAEPEGEAESFAPEAEGPPPPGSWSSGAAPEPEAEFEPEPEA